MELDISQIKKSDLLTQASADYPAYKVLDFSVGDISHYHGTEADITLTIQDGENSPVVLRGASFQNRHTSVCDFSGCSNEHKQFADEYAAHLLFKVGFDVGLEEVGDWKKL